MARFKNMSLVTPCANCPFRTDVDRYLTPGRYRELAHTLIDQGENFVCHKTVDYSGDDSQVTDKSCTCAGAMIFLQKLGRPNQAMQVMERIGAWSSDKLNMDAPVYGSREHFETGVEP